MQTHRSDVVVIGAGLAGIVASLELLSAGRSVLLLDRDAEAQLGGLARESFGGLFFVDTPEQRRAGVRDSPELALGDWLSYGGFGRDPVAERWPRRWAEAYVHESGDTYAWLRARGLRFMPMPLWVERGQYGGGNSVPRWHVTWGTGERLATRLIDALQAHPRRAALALRFDHRVDALVVEGGRVVGCRGVAGTPGAEFVARGDAVLVAAGGVNGSLERVRRHWPADQGAPPPVILNGAHRFADGRLHDAVEAIGGCVAHLDRMWNYAAGVHHWRPRKPEHGLSLVPPRSALWLDRHGARIWPPLVGGFDTLELVRAVCRAPGQYTWQVMNRAIALKELAISGAEFNPSIRTRSAAGFARDLLRGNRWLVDEVCAHCPDAVVAPTLDALAARMNALQGDDAVDAATLADAVHRYDAEIARGPALHNDEQLRRIAHLRRWRGDRMRTCAFRPIAAGDGGPLIAIRAFVISRKSLGGIRTDLDARVLDANDAPIPGLYAAGEAAGFGGGNMNGLRGLEGTFLGGCVHGARRAARAIRG